jgi:hypothetical protein
MMKNWWHNAARLEDEKQREAHFFLSVFFLHLLFAAPQRSPEFRKRQSHASKKLLAFEIAFFSCGQASLRFANWASVNCEGAAKRAM